MMITRANVLAVLPDTILPLVPWLIDVAVSSGGPPGSTRGLDGRFTVTIRENLELHQVPFVVQHELAHVLLHQLDVECSNSVHSSDLVLIKDSPDLVLTKEVLANWVVEEMEGGSAVIAELCGVPARAILDELGFFPDAFPSFYGLHTVLHELSYETEQTMCGGLLTDGSSLASAAGTIGLILALDNTSALGRLAAGKRFGDGTAAGHRTVIPVAPPVWATRVFNWTRAFVRQGLVESFLPTKPNRIYRKHGLVVPNWWASFAPRPDTILFLIDVSGSMWADQILSHCAGTIRWLTQQGISVRLIAGDTVVQLDQLVTQVPKSWPGGGGTDIRPLFKRAIQYSPRAIVCLTDGEIPAWPNMVAPTLWVLPQGVEQPFGEVARW